MMEFAYCKLEIFVPETHLEGLRQALQAADAGHIGQYDSCLSYSQVTSFWRPLDGAAPYSGTEVKVEVTCAAAQVEQVLAAIRRAHPYEEPVVNVIPLYRTSFQ